MTTADSIIQQVVTQMYESDFGLLTRVGDSCGFLTGWGWNRPFREAKFQISAASAAVQRHCHGDRRRRGSIP